MVLNIMQRYCVLLIALTMAYFYRSGVPLGRETSEKVHINLIEQGKVVISMNYFDVSY